MVVKPNILSMVVLSMESTPIAAIKHSLESADEIYKFHILLLAVIFEVSQNLQYSCFSPKEVPAGKRQEIKYLSPTEEQENALPAH